MKNFTLEKACTYTADIPYCVDDMIRFWSMFLQKYAFIKRGIANIVGHFCNSLSS